MFKPGTSGNPGGRPKGVARIRDMVQARGEDLIERLFVIAFDAATEDRARLEAIRTLLDRGYGRPPQPVDGDGSGGAIKITVGWLPVSDHLSIEDAEG